MALNTSSIINSEAPPTVEKEWKRFWHVLLGAVVLPLLFSFGALELVAWRAGETIPPAALAKEVRENPGLIWATARTEDYARVKFAQLAVERPEVLIIGTSRMAQFRSAMFRPYHCYNLGRISWPIQVYSDLLRHLPAGYSPKVILFGADFFMFSPDYNNKFAPPPPSFSPRSWSDHFCSLFDMAAALVWHPRLIWSRGDLFSGKPSRGVEALTGGIGFRKDGSEQWDDSRMKLAGRDPKPEEKTWWKRIIYPGDRVGADETRAMEEFVSLARSKGIALIGVQMPMFPAAVHQLEQNRDWGVLGDFRSQVAGGYFQRLGVPFFDFLTPSGHAEDYRYFCDAMHPGEPLCVEALLKMSSDPHVRSLLPALDIGALHRKLEEDQQLDQHLYLYRNEF